MARVTAKMREIGAKLVLAVDPGQLQPIEAGTPFRDVVARHGATARKTIGRQRENWQKAAPRELAAGQIPEALARYSKGGAVSHNTDCAEAIEALDASYAMDAQANPG